MREPAPIENNIGLMYLQGKNLYFENDMKIGEIIRDMDGEYKIFFEGDSGYTPTYLLDAIVKLLEKMNDPFERQMEAYFAGQLELNLEDDLAAGC
jgi:hypothetical protein